MEFQPPVADAPPSIPTRTRFNTTHRGSYDPTTIKRQSVPPSAGPEVISNLITSLSGISKPAEDYFDNPLAAGPSGSVSLPATPGGNRNISQGSFGVDYGAYNRPSITNLREDPVSLDDIAASSPVIRTSKPPSGYTSITAPKGSRSRQSSASREGGLRSFMRSSSAGTSRPSSGSSVVRNDDTHSIGNLSIERGSVPETELQHRRSHDSWGKKTGRSYKGLMYMSSKERLREREVERRSGGGTSSPSLLNLGVGPAGLFRSHSPSRPDPFLAETVIKEEPSIVNDTSLAPDRTDSPRPIPARDSSLRLTPGPRRGSRRPKRDSDATSETVPEGKDEARKPRSTRRVPNKLDLQHSSVEGKSFLLGADEQVPTPPAVQTPQSQRFLETIRDDYLAFDRQTKAEENDGAPFPAVSQNRRRSGQSADFVGQRKASQQEATQSEDNWPKRSSSRLKRLSQGESKTYQEQHREDIGGVPLERLDSVDSVDDAVETYLCSPRLTQRIRHPQTGRVICFSEVGDPEGSAVFCCVGMGLTRYITAFYDELALTLKLRLITPDRPGVGESESYSDGTATPLSWPDDVYAICQALKITKFSILAHSAGAIYALATALRMPQHIRGRIHLLAPWIPPSQMNVFGGSQTLPPTNAIPTSHRILRALPTPMLKIANSSFMSATSTSITTSLPKNSRRKKKAAANRESAAATRSVAPSPDKENMRFDNPVKEGRNGANNSSQVWQSGANNANGTRAAHKESVVPAASLDAEAEQERQMSYDIRLTHAIWALATTGANPAVDLMTCLERRHTIGFRYVDINRPVVIHHGSRDTRVPVENVKWLGKTMRRCEVRVLEGEGHGLMASATVMGSVLMEISKEWDDWMRVTGADGRKDKERGRRGTIGRG